MLRSILHCDMNNFYASVECMLDPALKKYPIAVCGSVEERHGIIDEDRRYNAQKFEEQFQNAKGLKNVEEGKTAPMPKFETSVELLDPMAEVQEESKVEEEKPAENSADENAALLAKLLSNPDTAALLKALAKTI